LDVPEGVDSHYRAEIGRAIRSAREARNMTQDELRSRLGKSKTSISNWETGKTAPTVENLRALCQVLDVAPELLLRMKVSNGKSKSRKPSSQPIEAIGARAAALRAEAEASVPGLIDGLKTLEVEVAQLRKSLDQTGT
jgi:transcriptional regulator with XRE-family HTH domain